MVQKFQLFGRGVHPLAVHQQLVGVQVDDQLVKHQLFLLLLLFAVSAQHGVDPGQHFLHLKGLGDIVVGAQLQAVDLVLQLALGGEHDDGHLGGLPDFAADGPAVHAGQHDVQHHQVGLELLELLQTHQSVVGHLTVHGLLFQIQTHQVGNVLVIFHDQYLTGHTCHPFFFCGEGLSLNFL